MCWSYYESIVSLTRGLHIYVWDSHVFFFFFEKLWDSHVEETMVSRDQRRIYYPLENFVIDWLPILSPSLFCVVVGEEVA